MRFIQFVLIGFVLLFTVNSCTTINAYFGGNKKTINEQAVIFYVPTNTTLNELKSSLVNAKIIDDLDGFSSVLKYKEFNDKMIGAGKYSIAPKTKYKTLINGFTLNNLGNGNKELEVKVTFNNCRDVKDIASKVSKQIEMDSAAFVNYILSDSILTKFGFNSAKISALFLPNTYHFYWDTDHVEFIDKMAKEFKKFWTAERMEKLRKSGLKNQSDAVTLASIVYKEQDKYPSEWKTIAGLYLNRLQKGWKLQSDPTFRFCWGDELKGVERLTFEHRDRDCPYNTYIYAGLPPGPIHIPPASVVDAVLNAENNQYMYMCAKPDGDGLHNFARTLTQHNRNARAFQNWLKTRKRK
ncbi:endolytic transglycosylase MltG [Brumimicrobium salinarum]|uniref:Endolytic murein transglycosylase n=1 Tax=Brumimicrobium salinarum TaxID=2058658 RepID=A0A2I0R4Y6_9FLAO|nr:endolytic transglycosylase MltG [Brumimicrobium salinarum]PKR81638.1 endolytic transglycosylase MltG [Brumimicrobium salinarum]